MEKYFVIGGSDLQKDFIIRIKERGYETHVFDYDPDCIGRQYADVFYEVSIDNKELILEIAQKEKPVAIHTVATEQGNITACYVSEKMGLLGNSYQLALATTDKSLMKKIFIEKKIDTPISKAYHKDDFINYDQLELPCMVKSSDRSAGRGIKLVSHKHDFKEAVSESLEYSYNKTILIEEYFDAPQFSVETISFDGDHKVVAITQMGFSGEPYFVEHVHYLPAPLNSDLEKLIQDFTINVLNSFNIRVGACHLELRVKNGVIKIIEIASRMGGWRHWMINSSLSYNYLDAIIDSTVGKKSVQEKIVGSLITMSRHVINSKEMRTYYRVKQEYPEAILVDHVRVSDAEFSAQNLIETKGFYIILTSEDNLSKMFEKEEIEDYKKYVKIQS